MEKNGSLMHQNTLITKMNELQNWGIYVSYKKSYWLQVMMMNYDTYCLQIKFIYLDTSIIECSALLKD